MQRVVRQQQISEQSTIAEIKQEEHILMIAKSQILNCFPDDQTLLEFTHFAARNALAAILWRLGRLLKILLRLYWLREFLETSFLTTTNPCNYQLQSG